MEQKITNHKLIQEIESLLERKYKLRFDTELSQLEFAEFRSENWKPINQEVSEFIEKKLVFTEECYQLEEVIKILKAEVIESDKKTDGKTTNKGEPQILTGNNTSSSVTVNSPAVGKPSYIHTGQSLYDMGIQEFSFLIEGLIQDSGLVALTGSSDAGKSSFLRQMAIAIVTGAYDFLGLKINAKYRRVLIVSTEDNDKAISYLLRKQTEGTNLSGKELFYIGYIFDTQNLIQKLDNTLSKYPVACVIIDAFADLYTGDMNQSNKIRIYLNQFQRLSDKYKTVFVFLHHTKKGSQHSAPSKDNVLGSQGFEAKMRLVLELRKDPDNPEIRYLSIVKGNYVPESFKKDAMVLKFDDNMRFTNTNQKVSNSKLVQSKYNRESKYEIAKKRALELKRNENLSVRAIRDKLKSEGYNIGKSTVANWLQDFEEYSGLYFYVDPEECITVDFSDEPN